VSQTNNVIFEAGETITGSNGATGTIHHYRRNPLNASKVALDWSEFPSPNNDLFYNFRYELFENWPEDLDIDKKSLQGKLKKFTWKRVMKDHIKHSLEQHCQQKA
jgi:hypothetical protein